MGAVENAFSAAEFCDRCLQNCSFALLQCDAVLLCFDRLYVGGAVARVSGNGMNGYTVSHDDFLSILDFIRCNVVFIVVAALQVLSDVDTCARRLVIGDFLERMKFLSFIAVVAVDEVSVNVGQSGPGQGLCRAGCLDFRKKDSGDFLGRLWLVRFIRFNRLIYLFPFCVECKALRNWCVEIIRVFSFRFSVPALERIAVFGRIVRFYSLSAGWNGLGRNF